MRSLPRLATAPTQRAPRRRLHPVLAGLRRSRAVWIGGTLLATLVLVALAAPLLAPDAPNAQNWQNRLLPPGPGHPFGTDEFGRSVLTRVLYGGRVSLLSGFLPVLLASSVGTLIGLIAGGAGRLADTLLMRLVDVLLAFPGVLLALAIVGLFGPSFSNAVLAIGVVGIPVYARLVRAEVLRLREGEFVEAARALGTSTWRVLWRHLLPNVAPVLIVQSTLGVGGAILATASLSFLGLGVQPPTSDWGEMLASGRSQLPQAWWLEVFPGLMITLTVLAVNLLGDGLRDALDPRARR
ncbi:ABC transporter permease [Deinococcus hopiensis]|uniref:Peptide/nickel transport system permease protein n=1 Tax=Deinococcus hopiensis KR-140 TaxID=695939 RepID=A0A1W1URE1_9DEIO|nr:ABC transporter permease [Deinococcus hopiensis]SMB83274.1 peptide/nickel transport system permease protein [Deinococcus hopiensis KR-140]